MAVWLSGLATSNTVNYDTRKWARWGGAGASGTLASVLRNTELDMTNVGGTSATAETLFTLTANASITSWTGAVRFSANTAGADSASQQFNSTIWLCHDGTVSTTGTAINGYSLNFTLNAIQVRKTVGGTTTVLGSVGALDLTKKYLFRFERTSGAIRARVWDYAATEPTDWNVYTGALDGGITAGRGAVSQFRYRSTKAGAYWSELSYSGPGARPYDAPLNFRSTDGARVAKGRSRSVLAAGMFDATLPSTITGTTTFDTSTLRRTLTAAANSSATIVFPSVPASAVEYIQFDVENLALDANTGVTYQIGFLGGSPTPLVMEENQSYGNARLIAGTTTRDLKAQVFATNVSPATSEQSNHRNLRVALLTRVGQLQIAEGDSGLFGGGWWNVGAAVTGTLIPTFTVTATGAAARSASFTRIALTVESL